MPTDPESQQFNVLGLSTAELAGLSVDELFNNRTAIMMLLHYYKQLVDENTGLKNQVNTLNTYVSGYERKKTYSAIGGSLLALSTVLVAFGVNLLTGGSTWAGLASLIPGIALIAVGLYYSHREVS